MNQRKPFYMQRIQDVTYARKETITIDIFITSANSDGKLM